MSLFAETQVEKQKEREREGERKTGEREGRGSEMGRKKETNSLQHPDNQFLLAQTK